MFQALTASGPADFVDKLAAFCVTAGWTLHRNAVVGTTRTATVRKSGDYIHFWSTTNGVWLRASVGIDTGALGSAQPLQAQYGAWTNLGAGPYPNVLFFADNSPAEHVFIVTEITAGRYRHMGFGELAHKAGAFTGGTWFDGTYWLNDGFSYNSEPDTGYSRIMFGNMWYPDVTVHGYGGVRCDYDGRTNHFSPFANRYVGTNAAATGIGGIDGNGGDRGNDGMGFRVKEGFHDRSINAWSAQTPLQPIQVRVYRASTYWTPIGEIPGIRFLNMTRFSIGEEFTVGTDTWQVFPWIRRGPTSGSPTWTQATRERAFAYRKVP